MPYDRLPLSKQVLSGAVSPSGPSYGQRKNCPHWTANSSWATRQSRGKPSNAPSRS
jgi:hypothetical protein